MNPTNTLAASLVATAAFFAFACSPSKPEDNGSGLTKIILQTDWYAQPEHGGFYQAVAEGYYEEAGLDVEIRPGGPNITTTQQLVQGTVQFGIGRSDTVVIASAQGIPIVMTGALMQRDPQAILFHKESGIEKFEDLDGKTIMAAPGSPFISMIEKIYGIKVNVTPLDYGMSRFLGDKDFIQQCFITNEPYYVRKQGANPGTLLISDSGFSPYRVWFTSKGFARKNPEIVEAFNKASIRGWREYLFGDRSAANELISAANPKQTPDFMDYVHGSMIDNRLVTGSPELGEEIGQIKVSRIANEIKQLIDIGMLDTEVEVESILIPSIVESSEAMDAAPETSDLSLKLRHSDGSSASISWEQLKALPTKVIEHPLEFDNVPRQTTIAYLSDFLDAYGDGASDFWIANCSDSYQSNYTPEQIAQTRPFIIIEINQDPLPNYLASLGHPEWGPYIINVEDSSSLLDPGHKNPWGVAEIISLRRSEALAGIEEKATTPEQIHGMQQYIDSCASCHDMGNGIMGGKISSRSINLLAAFATGSEEYFRKVLIDPLGTNPLAEKMPSYAHYSEEQIEALISYLASQLGS